MTTNCIQTQNDGDSVTFSVRLPKNVVRMMKELASYRGESCSVFIRRAVLKELDMTLSIQDERLTPSTRAYLARMNEDSGKRMAEPQDTKRR